MALVLVPPGGLEMGSNEPGAPPEEKPVHKVRISQPFHIGRYEVTVAQFRCFAEATKYQTEAERLGVGWTVKDGNLGPQPGTNWRSPGFKQEDNHPVCVVTWNDAQEFCKWATKSAGRTVRLPTEAEWEYAARGPKGPKYPWGDTWDGALVNHADQTRKNAGLTLPTGTTNDNDGYACTAPVGTYKGNASWCGAFDLAGNVWEWCEDRFSSTYYAESPPLDPPGPAAGTARVLRGGCWLDAPGGCRSAYRHSRDPGHRTASYGFRVVVVGAPTRTP
jgi:formylglycine-generating enzyme required for sulfatase activity